MADIHPNDLSEIVAQALSQGHLPILTVESNSMAPVIRIGDELQVVPTAVVNLTPGEVIILKTEEGLLVHRYWRMDTNFFPQRLVTKGDRLRYFDHSSTSDQLLGSVSTRSRGSRTLSFETPIFRFTNILLFQLCRIEQWLLKMLYHNSYGTSHTAGASGEAKEFGRGSEEIRWFIYALSWYLNLTLGLHHNSR